jgi:hypothetical protein
MIGQRKQSSRSGNALDFQAQGPGGSMDTSARRDPGAPELVTARKPDGSRVLVDLQGRAMPGRALLRFEDGEEVLVEFESRSP